MKTPEVVYLHRSSNSPRIPSPPPKQELRCYVCDRRAELGAVGWETARIGDFCPKHRRERPPAIVTLGELIQRKR